jgi:hypothetical protein
MESKYLFEDVHCDLVNVTQKDGGFSSIVVMMDERSSYCVLVPVMAESRGLLSHIFERFESMQIVKLKKFNNVFHHYFFCFSRVHSNNNSSLYICTGPQAKNVTLALTILSEGTGCPSSVLHRHCTLKTWTSPPLT